MFEYSKVINNKHIIIIIHLKLQFPDFKEQIVIYINFNYQKYRIFHNLNIKY